MNSQTRTLFSYGFLAFAYVALWTLFRLWFCGQFELLGDESYYWVWSRHLDWAYYSKGPGVAWTIFAGTWVERAISSILHLREYIELDTERGIRWPAVLLGAGTAFYLFKLARDLFDSKTAFWCVIVASLIPLFVVGGFLMTIDPLSVFFWSLAAWLFWENRDHKSWWSWIPAGLAVGAGMLCKYTNVAELIAFALFSLWIPTYRNQLFSRKFMWMVIFALLCLTPPIYWNIEHGWPTLQHLVHRGALDETWSFSLRELWKFLWKQFLVFNPLFSIGLILALLFMRKDDLRSEKYAYLLSLFLPLILFYSILSLKKAGEANWTAPSYFTGVILLTVFWQSCAAKNSWIKHMVQGALILSACAVIAAHLIVFLPPQWLPEKDPLRRIRGGWKELSGHVEYYLPCGAPYIIMGDNYQLASLLSFYMHTEMPSHHPTYLVRDIGIQNQYSIWPSYDCWIYPALIQYGVTGFYVTSRPEIPLQLKREFANVNFLKEVVTHHGNPESETSKPIRTFYIYRCFPFGGEEESIEIKPVP